MSRQTVEDIIWDEFEEVFYDLDGDVLVPRIADKIRDIVRAQISNDIYELSDEWHESHLSAFATDDHAPSEYVVGFRNGLVAAARRAGER